MSKKRGIGLTVLVCIITSIITSLLLFFIAQIAILKLFYESFLKLRFGNKHTAIGKRISGSFIIKSLKPSFKSVE